MDGKTTNLGHSPVFSAVCAEPLWDFLKKLAISIDSKMPATPGVNSTLATSFEQLATSQTVRVTRENTPDLPTTPAQNNSPVSLPATGATGAIGATGATGATGIGVTGG
jgi:hypothetical protein